MTGRHRPTAGERLALALIASVAEIKALSPEERKIASGHLRMSGDWKKEDTTLAHAMAMSSLATFVEEAVDCTVCEDDPFLDPCKVCGRAPTR